MGLSLGEILFAYAHLEVDIDETVFYDNETRKFIVAMKKQAYESMIGLGSWGEVSVKPISKEAFVREYNHLIYARRVNDKTEELKLALLTGDWAVLTAEFPDTIGKAFKVNNTINPSALTLDEDGFYPFFPDWDDGFKGLRDDDFIVFYAPPKHGKSTITAYLAYEAIKNGVPIGFYPTELSLSVTLKYILGFEYGLRGNEALVFFADHHKELTNAIKKYNHLIYFPPTNMFNWSDYEALYESPAKFIFHDNIVRSVSQLGLNEDSSSFAQVSRKLATLQQKYKKATFLVTQEAMREATPKELEANPDKYEIGKGHTYMSRALLQESSLALLVRTRQNSQVRELMVKNDRFRGAGDVNTQIFTEITSRGKIKVTKVKDAMEETIRRIESKMFESKSVTKEEKTGYFTGLAQHINGDIGDEY
jgi:hypothetical protein